MAWHRTVFPAMQSSANLLYESVRYDEAVFEILKVRNALPARADSPLFVHHGGKSERLDDLARSISIFFAPTSLNETAENK